MRLRKPSKVGDGSAPWLRHDVRVNEWVAKTCRYLVSRVGFDLVVVALFSWVGLVERRAVVSWSTFGRSKAVAMAVSVIVAMAESEQAAR